jgi:hypothetical protein
MQREVTSTLLSALLVFSPLVDAAPSTGTVQGTVTVEGRPLSGMEMALVELSSGAIHRVKSGPAGSFKVNVRPGQYVLTSMNPWGLSVGRAPSRLVVTAGKVASAAVELLPVTNGAQTPPQPGAQGSGIQHEPIGCLVAGQFPLIDAVIEPASSVARARVYFKSSLGTAYYFVEMTLSEGKFLGKLPKPKAAEGTTPITITYYIQATTTEFGESQTPEIEAIVVADASECPEGKRVAPIGPPGAVTVFSSATGAAVGTVAGVAGVAGGAIAAGTVALVAGGAAVAAGAAAAAAGGGATTTVATAPPGPPPTTVPPTTTLPPTTTTTTTTTLPPPPPTTTTLPPSVTPFKE